MSNELHVENSFKPICVRWFSGNFHATILKNTPSKKEEIVTAS